MKSLSILIHRPVVALVLNLALVVLGYFGYQNLGIRQYPNIVQPVVNVQTTYIGSDPELMERQITSPIEDQLSGIEGMRYYTSTSRQGLSQIRITFELGRDLDAAAAEVRARVQAAQDNFPPDAKPPIVTQQSSSSSIIYLSLSSERWSVPRLTQYFELAIKTRMESIQGVQEVRSFGTKYGMRLWIDPTRLAARRMTPLDVVRAVNTSNVDLPGGQLYNQFNQYQVRAQSTIDTADAFNRMIVAYRDGYPIRLGDIGYAQLSGEYVPPQSSFSINGRRTLGMAVNLFAGADALAVAEKVREMLPELRDDLPAGLKLGINYDRTVFIEEAIWDVVKTIGEAVVLVIIVVVLFLRSARAVAIPIVTIPLSLVGAMGLMYGLGFSINLLTLLALVLAIGLVVDDGIVVLENTQRHIEEGRAPIDAAVVSLREIAFPVVATTLTLALVYIPIGFQSGQTGTLFRQFSFTLGGTVLISGYIALTLSPVMCSRILKKPRKKQEEEGWMQRVYERMLRFTLDHLRLGVIVAALLIGGGVYFLYVSMPSELLPTQDQSVVFTAFKGPDGANYNYMKTYADRIAEIMEREVPENERILSIVGNPQPNQGIVIAVLGSKGERERSQQQIVRALFPSITSLSGVQAVPLNPPPPAIGGESNQKVNFVMTTIGSYQTLEKAVHRMLGETDATGMITHGQSDLDLNVLNFDVEIDRAAASSVNVQTEDVSRTLAASLAPFRTTRIKQKGKVYDVFIQMQPQDRRNPSVINQLYVHNNAPGGASASAEGEPADGDPLGGLVPLASLVDVTPSVGPIYLNHYNGRRSVTLNADVAEGASLGNALHRLQAYAGEHFEDVTPQFTGYSDTYLRSQGQFVYLFAAAIVIVYLVLAAMFNSFVDPFVILLTVPLSLFGALGLLKLTGGSLNLYSNIGLVTLVGLISKHGILIVDFANELRREGWNIEEAIVESAKLRLRPILMTTGAMVLGAAPLAYAWGAGAEARHPLGWIIIGGLTFGTLMTLVVIPTVYSYLAHLERAGEDAGEREDADRDGGGAPAPAGG